MEPGGAGFEGVGGGVTEGRAGFIVSLMGKCVSYYVSVRERVCVRSLYKMHQQLRQAQFS